MEEAKPIVAAFALVLPEVAAWSRQALGDPEEYSRRDKLLVELEAIAHAVTKRETGSSL